MAKKSVYDIIADGIIKSLENDIIPWQQPWSSVPHKSLNSGKPYRGINPFLLESFASFHNFKSNYWLTFKQAKKLGGQVKKGSSGTQVIFWRWIEKKDKHDEVVSSFPMLRYYTVFNAEQVNFPDDYILPVDEINADFNPIDEAQKIVDNMPNAPDIKHRGNRAVYFPVSDRIMIPDTGQFNNPGEYYSTLFHELGHSTGHSARLARFNDDSDHNFGSKDYSFEELVAEFTAAMLCGAANIDKSVIENQTAYIAGWLTSLRNNKKMAVRAAAKAQKAADYILGVA